MRRILAVPALACLSLGSARADRAPAWLTDAMAADTSRLATDASAVVLLDEQRVTVERFGRQVIVGRHAVRILTPVGAREARAEVTYAPDTEKVSGLSGWLVAPSGKVEELPSDSVYDTLANADDVYDELREATMSAEARAAVGCVVGFEWKVTREPLFSQLDWRFGSALPCAVSRLVLEIPGGATPEVRTFNHDPLVPTVAGGALTFEVRDLPYLPREPFGTPAAAVRPWIGVNLPPTDGGGEPGGVRLSTWGDVARYVARLAEPTAVPDGAITAKAAALTADAATTFDKIRAIGKHVQGVRYVSIQTGLGRGGGYRPHRATDVFAKSYGDCKDKATLLRAMLKAVGVAAHPVVVRAGDLADVSPDWPSPQQFDHVIVAVAVDASVRQPAVFEHPTLGRLLFFDPTDAFVPVGRLPAADRGDWVLPCAAGVEALFRIPASTPEESLRSGTVELAVKPDGSIAATGREDLTGDIAELGRRALDLAGDDRFRKGFESAVASVLPGARLVRFATSHDAAAGTMSVTYALEADGVAQHVGDALLMIRPVLSGLESGPEITSCDGRRRPIERKAHLEQDVVILVPPDGMGADDLPDKVALDGPLSRYALELEAQPDGSVRIARTLRVERGRVPAAECAAVRSFVERVAAADRSPVVLAQRAPAAGAR